MLNTKDIFIKCIAIFAIANYSVAGAFALNLASNDEITATQSESATAAANEQNSEAGVSGSYLSSQFSRSTGDIESAIKSLRSVYKKKPQDIDIANQLMGLCLLAGRVDEAVEIASNITKTNKKESIPALMLSLRAIKNNDTTSASRILDEVFEDGGGQLWLPLISAWLDVEQRKLLKPLRMEELSAEVGRAAPVVNYHLALINARAGFIKEAAENFKQSVDGATHPPTRVMQALLQFYEKNKSPEILKPIVKAYQNANKDSATTKPLEISNIRDGVAEVLFTMGSIMLASDAIQDAALYLQLTLYLKPDMEIATIALAQAYSELQQYVIAGELLSKIPPKSQLYSTAQLYTAVNLGKLEKIDEAITKLDNLISSSPNDIEAYIAKGDLLRAQEKFTDAIVVYKAALATLKEEKAQHWPILFAISICFDKLGDWVETEKNLKHSLKLSPDQPDVLNYLGYSLLIRGENLQQAKALIEKASKKRPSDPQIMDSYGWVLYLLGDYSKALSYLEAAVSLLPADVTVNDHLGDLYWRLGRKTEARFQWDRAITYAKDDAAAQEIRKKLKDGLPQLSANAIPMSAIATK